MEKFNIVATTLFGLEEILANEIKNIGGENIEIYKRAVGFSGTMTQVFRANLELRTAIRVLLPVAEFEANDEKELYDGIFGIEWDNFIEMDQTFAIDSGTSGPIFTHSKYAGLKSKDAIADYFRSKYGKRPNVDPKDPDIAININIAYNKVRVTLDSSGDTLDRRNYRYRSLDAPISEALAAGILLMAGYNGSQPLYDPMCGAGTFSIEAALIATKTPPGLNRRFACLNWSWINIEEFYDLKEDLRAAIIPTKQPIYASDIEHEAISITKENAERAKIFNSITYRQADFFVEKPEEAEGLVFLNPPYDERISLENADQYYSEIGDALKQNYTGYEAWLISSNMPAMKRIGLRPKTKRQMFNGPLECKLNQYELFTGSKYN